MHNLQSEFYTPLNAALPELQRRRSDASLRRRVASVLGETAPPDPALPKAFLGRFIATPNFEMLRFLELASRLELRPVVMELTRDTFCTRNLDKLSLMHMPFFKGTDRTGTVMFQYRNVGDCTRYQGDRFVDIATYSGEALVDLHHRLLLAQTRTLPVPPLIDEVSHLHIAGRPRVFYSRILPRVICHGILFEEFTVEKEEQEFFAQVVFPAFAETTRQFGVKPLVVPFLPHPENIFWLCYHNQLEEHLFVGGPPVAQAVRAGSTRVQRALGAREQRESLCLHSS